MCLIYHQQFYGGSEEWIDKLAAGLSKIKVGLIKLRGKDKKSQQVGVLVKNMKAGRIAIAVKIPDRCAVENFFPGFFWII